MFLEEVIEPIVVYQKDLDLERLPDWKPILAELPIGCGVKGGVARKILKVITGLGNRHPDFVAEKNGDGDLDILVAIPSITPAIRLEIRERLAGVKIGGVELHPKDIEVSDNLTRYFLTRDVTMNEVIAYKVSDSNVVLLYTEIAQRDVYAGVVRPAIHCLHTIFTQNWFLDHAGKVVIAPKPLSRCILRYLKGHGVTYGIDSDTWSYYQTVSRLEPRDLFRIVRHFVDDNQKFDRCIQHLSDLDLIGHGVDGNALWGHCLFETNQKLATHEHRLSFGEPDAKKVEDWIGLKEREYQEWQRRRSTLISVGHNVDPDVTAKVLLPQGFEVYPSFFI